MSALMFCSVYGGSIWIFGLRRVRSRRFTLGGICHLQIVNSVLACTNPPGLVVRKAKESIMVRIRLD